MYNDRRFEFMVVVEFYFGQKYSAEYEYRIISAREEMLTYAYLFQKFISILIE